MWILLHTASAIGVAEPGAFGLLATGFNGLVATRRRHERWSGFISRTNGGFGYEPPFLLAVATRRGNTRGKSRRVPMAKERKKPTGEEKRKLYAIAFCIAGGIEYFRYIFSDGPYHPTLFGLAILIAAFLYFAYSWIKDR